MTDRTVLHGRVTRKQSPTSPHRQSSLLHLAHVGFLVTSDSSTGLFLLHTLSPAYNQAGQEGARGHQHTPDPARWQETCPQLRPAPTGAVHMRGRPGGQCPSSDHRGGTDVSTHSREPLQMKSSLPDRTPAAAPPPAMLSYLLDALGFQSWPHRPTRLPPGRSRSTTSSAHDFQQQAPPMEPAQTGEITISKAVAPQSSSLEVRSPSVGQLRMPPMWRDRVPAMQRQHRHRDCSAVASGVMCRWLPGRTMHVSGLGYRCDWLSKSPRTPRPRGL